MMIKKDKYNDKVINPNNTTSQLSLSNLYYRNNHNFLEYYFDSYYLIHPMLNYQQMNEYYHFLIGNVSLIHSSTPVCR